MNILVIGHSVAHYRQRKMWEWIAEQGHKVNTVVMPQYRDEKYQPMKKGSFTQNITSVHAPQVGNNYWLFPDLHGIVHTIDPDFIFCIQEPWTFCAYHVLMIAKMFQKPFGFFTWENIIKTWPMPWRYMEGQVIKDAVLAVGGNKDACQILLQKNATHVVQEIQTGLDVDLFFPEPKLITKDKVEPKKLLFVGRLTEAKGIDVILRAFDKLPEGEYVLRFVGGRGESEPLIRQHPKFGKDITLEPWMEHERLSSVYNWADVSLMPSIDTPMWIEQCGYALGESVLCHVPAITSTSKSIMDLWKDIPDIHFVQQGDIDALVTMIKDDDIYKPAKDGRQAVIEKYSVEKVGQHYIDMISDLI